MISDEKLHMMWLSPECSYRRSHVFETETDHALFFATACWFGRLLSTTDEVTKKKSTRTSKQNDAMTMLSYIYLKVPGKNWENLDEKLRCTCCMTRIFRRWQADTCFGLCRAPLVILIYVQWRDTKLTLIWFFPRKIQTSYANYGKPEKQVCQSEWHTFSWAILLEHPKNKY